MQNSITVMFKNQFGTETIVPVCETAKHFASIAGTKTLSKPVIASIKQLGFVVNVQQTVRTI